MGCSYSANVYAVASYRRICESVILDVPETLPAFSLSGHYHSSNLRVGFHELSGSKPGAGCESDPTDACFVAPQLSATCFGLICELQQTWYACKSSRLSFFFTHHAGNYLKVSAQLTRRLPLDSFLFQSTHQIPRGVSHTLRWPHLTASAPL